MKRLALLAVPFVLLAGSSAFADKPFNPDCHLQGINHDLDGVIAQIKSSPAMGHAGGHYKRSIEDLERVRKQLHEGCHAWNSK